MNKHEWSYLGHHKALNVSFLQAFHAARAYPRHSHDYYVIAVVDSGLQSFTCGSAKYITPVDGLILLNPGVVHTGEPVNEQGFGYSAFYPTAEHMAMLAGEFGQREPQEIYFATPRADALDLTRSIRALLAALRETENLLECETRFLWTLAELVKHYGDKLTKEARVAIEHSAVRQVKDYIHENYAHPISLAELAEHVQLSRYYLLHTFRKAMGMPPHLYLESVRVRQAQKLLVQGQSLVEVAYQVGFGSQSHFTQRFKQIIGVTPGAYARQLRDD